MPLLTLPTHRRLPTCRYDVETTISLIAMTGMAHAPERSLVDEAKDGDQGAFGSLYQQYVRMVHGILLARVPRSEVEDLVQDVFLLAWRRLRSLRDTKAFGGWLAMIARNQAIDYHRQAPKTVELDPTLLKQRPPEPEALAVLDTIRALPDAYRETLLLRLVEGLTGPEIAVQTGLTPDSVRVNLHRGMKMLRERIEGRSAQ
jgi:RNA polymerase sigma-70 factor, ECF subfamily